MSNDITFYDRSGTAVAYTQDNEHIYLFNGQPVAYFKDDSIYTFNGIHIGRFTKGWIRDNDGYCVFFTPEAEGGPVKPVKRVKSVKSVKRVKTVKSVRKIKPVKKVDKLSWTSFTVEEFF